MQLLLEEEEASPGEESTKIRSKVGGGHAKTLRTSFSSLSIASSKFFSTALKADSPLRNCTCRKHSKPGTSGLMRITAPGRPTSAAMSFQLNVHVFEDHQQVGSQ